MTTSGEWTFRVPLPLQSKVSLYHEQAKELKELETRVVELGKRQRELETLLAPYRVGTTSSSAIASNVESSLLPSNYVKLLPNELLLLIFDEFLRPRWTHRNIRKLLLVCRQWHDLVMKSPKLWARVEICNPRWSLEMHGTSTIRYVSACIERSKPLLLKMDLNFEDFPDRKRYFMDHVYATLSEITDEADHGELMDDLCKHEWNYSSSQYEQLFADILDGIFGENSEYLERCEAMALSLAEESESPYYITKRLNHCTPHLTSLEIRDPGATVHNNGFLNWFPDLSSLSNLNLRYDIHPDNFKIAPTQLRHLKFDIYDDESPKCLPSFQNLNSLSLSFCPPHLVDLHAKPIRLIHLTKLHLFGDWQCLHDFDIPSLDNLHLEIAYTTKDMQFPKLEPQHILLELRYRQTRIDLPKMIISLLSLSNHTKTLTLNNIDRSVAHDALQQFKKTKETTSVRKLKVENNGVEEEIII